PSSPKVLTMLYGVSDVIERSPTIELGAITSEATWPPAAFAQQPADDAPSSQVMKRTPPFWKAEEARMLGTTLPNQPSPVAIEQSCMSLHMLGVIQAKFGTVPAERSALNCVDGTTCALQRAALVRM